MKRKREREKESERERERRNTHLCVAGEIVAGAVGTANTLNPAV
jgi:hypothetical protein